MSLEALLVACIFVPLLAAPALVAVGRWPNAREAVSLVAAGALLVMVAIITSVVGGGEETIEVTLAPILPGLDLALRAEPLALVFALVAGSLWLVTTVYAVGYMRGHHEKNQTRFFACFAIAIGAAMGVAFSANVLTLFVFYEVLSISTYPLVTHSGTPEAKRSGRIYIGILMGASLLFFLPAVVWTWAVAGTLDFQRGGILEGRIGHLGAGLLLALYVFGIAKAAIMPLHRWLPAAMVAPTPVSALLHAVAVVKAGVFSVIKVVVLVFGPEMVADLDVARALTWLAALTIVLSSLIAMRQDNLKRRLAYSTVSQLSYVLLGALLATSGALTGAAMHVFMHAFGKITLFFCAGAIMVATHCTQVSQLDGMGRRMPFTFGAFALGALSIAGLPPLGGAWSKFYLAMGAFEAEQLALLGVLAASTLMNLYYLLVIPARAFLLPVPQGSGGDHVVREGESSGASRGIAEAPLACVVPLCVTALVCVALFFFAAPLAELAALATR